MKNHLLAATAVVSLALGGASVARAQGIPVHDNASFLKLLEQSVTAGRQLEQLQQQVTQGGALLKQIGANSNINNVAQQLNALRSSVPQQLMTSVGLGNTTTANLGDLGSISAAAQAIRQQNRLYTPTFVPGQTNAEAFYQNTLEQSGNRAARDLAVGQQVSTIAGSRQAGLDQLRSQLDVAPDARAVLDIQARLQAENAMIANDNMRMQGIAMQQTAQDRLDAQRQREQAAKTADALASWGQGLHQ